MVTKSVAPIPGVFKPRCAIAAVFPESIDVSEAPVAPARAGGGSGPSGPGGDDPVRSGAPASELLLATEVFVVATFEALDTERDLLDCGDGFDPAVDQWRSDARVARSTAIDRAINLIIDFPGHSAAELRAQEMAWWAIVVFTSDSPVRVARVRSALGRVRVAHLRAQLGCEALSVWLDDAAVLLRAYIDLEAPAANGGAPWIEADDPGPTVA